MLAADSAQHASRPDGLSYLRSMDQLGKSSLMPVLPDKVKSFICLTHNRRGAPQAMVASAVVATATGLRSGRDVSHRRVDVSPTGRDSD